MSGREAARDLVLVGNSSLAEIAFEYFSKDSDYRVVAFAVERAYLRREELFGLPVVPLEELPERYRPERHSAHVAIPYTQLNRLRHRLVAQLDAWGYSLASYISSRAFVWDNAQLGRHCFIFEDNTVQPFVSIGEGTILWSGNHIGHHSRIGSYCFISSHVVVSGHCEVGDRCFLGVNSTIGNNVTIGEECWIGPGTTIVRDVPPQTLYRGRRDEPAEISSVEFLRKKGWL